MNLQASTPMTPQEIEKLFLDRENSADVPRVLVPCVHGVPFNAYFLLPDEIEPGSISEFLKEIGIAGESTLYYICPLYRSEYYDAKVRRLRTKG